MSRKVRADLQAFAASLSPGSGGRSRHSPLFRWLYDRSDAFKRVLEDTRPSWDAVTTALTNEGLTNGDGKPLTRRRVQKTWYAVEQAKGWHDKPVPAPQPVIKAIPPPTLPFSRLRPDDGEDVPMPARTFGTAVLRNHVPSVPPSPAMPAETQRRSDPDPDRANQVIEALMSGAPRNRFKATDGE